MEVQPPEYCYELGLIEDPNKGNSISSPIPPLNLDVPTAIRKGSRSCTMHAMSKYVSYHRLSPIFKGSTTHLSGLEIPKKYPGLLYLFQNGER